MSPSTLKAGLAGSLGLLVVLLISLVPIPFPLGTCLVTLGFFVVWIGTGILAGLLAEDEIQTRRQAVLSGAMAGFVAGIGGGIAGMLVAAFGALFPDLGAGVVAQFSPAQLESLARMGITPDAIQLAGSIVSAMLVCGLGGAFIAVALGSLGGRLYFRLR
ncbi:MAG: hypothetical protein Kow0063_23170 [Anaerolineae bacterium]